MISRPELWPSSGHATVPRPSPGRAAVLRSSSGQATVELVALLPLLLAVALSAAALVAGHSASEQAGIAAQAGAMALLQGGDPREAARRSLPAALRPRATIAVDGRRVTVRLRPRLPAAVAAAMTAEVSADAGPVAVPVNGTGDGS
jgi:Flp pilus assembly protein TadG